MKGKSGFQGKVYTSENDDNVRDIRKESFTFYLGIGEEGGVRGSLFGTDPGASSFRSLLIRLTG